MEFRDYLRVLRRGWRLMAVLLVLGAAVGGVFVSVQPKQYSSTAKAFVTVESAGTSTDLTNGATYAQQAANGYAAIATTAYVLDPVIRRLALHTTSGTLARDVTVVVEADSPTLDVTVTDEFAPRAARIANAITAQLSSAAIDLAPQTTAASAAAAAADATVKLTPVDPAIQKRRPVGPSWPVGALLGGVAGAVLAVLLGLARELLDTRIRTRDDVERVTDAAILGTVLRDPRDVRSSHLARAEDPRAETYRTIRTNLRFVHLDPARRSLVITSSVDGEGKSTLASNLALALAAVGGRVLLIDADLRRPRLDEYFGVDGAVGLTDVLIGAVDLAGAVQRTADGGPDLLPAGTIPPNPNELLQSPAMHALVERLHGEYDLVLFDSPPLLAVSDAVLLAERTGGAIVAVAAGRVGRAQLATALRSLQAAETIVAGLVLTMVPRRGPDGDSAGYGYGYGAAGEPVRARRGSRLARARRTPVSEERFDEMTSAAPVAEVEVVEVGRPDPVEPAPVDPVVVAPVVVEPVVVQPVVVLPTARLADVAIAEDLMLRPRSLRAVIEELGDRRTAEALPVSAGIEWFSESLEEPDDVSTPEPVTALKEARARRARAAKSVRVPVPPELARRVQQQRDVR